MKLAGKRLIGLAGIEHIITLIQPVHVARAITVVNIIQAPQHRGERRAGRGGAGTAIYSTIVTASLITRCIHDDVVGVASGILCVGRSELTSAIVGTHVGTEADAAHSGLVLTVGIVKDILDTVGDVGVVQIFAATNENQV